MGKKLVINIKLISVDFVPTWWFEDDEGNGGTKTTPIGQMSLDAEQLPEEIVEALKILATVAWREHLAARGVS